MQKNSLGEGLPFKGYIEYFEELTQGGLVHDIDHAHFCDEEVKNAAARGNGTIFRLSQIDFCLSFCRHT